MYKNVKCGVTHEYTSIHVFRLRELVMCLILTRYLRKNLYSLSITVYIYLQKNQYFY